MAYVKIRPRRGTASQWEYANPILSEGEMAFEVPATGVGTGVINIKQGDGQNSWNNLPYAFNGGTINNKVDDLATTVASYDATISTLTSKVNAMEINVKNVRKIEIQSSDPVAEDLILGEIWINTDMVTGAMYITDESGSQITELNLPVGSTYNIRLTNTITAASIIEWKSTDDQICSITNKSPNGCTLNANMATDGVTITALAKSDPTTVLMNAKLRVSITVNAGIEVVPSNIKLIVGKGANLALNKTSSGTTFDMITWTSVSPNYVEITSFTDNGAAITALRGGSSLVRADAKINGFTVASSSCMVVVGGISFAGGRDIITANVGDVVTLNLVYTNMVITEDYDAIVWSSDNNEIVRINRSDNNSGTIGVYSAGSTYIRCRATKLGEVVQEIRCLFNVTGRLSIEPPTFELEIGGNSQRLDLNNELGEGNWDRIEWDSEDENIIRVDYQGVDIEGNYAMVSATGAGSAVISATAYLNNIIVGTTSSFGTVSGNMYIEYQETECSALTLTLGTEEYKANLRAVVEAIPSITNYSWLTSNPSIVKITSGAQGIQCTIEGQTEGVANITLQGLDGPGGNIIATYVCEVTVESN